MKILVPATSANLGPGFDTLGLALNLCNETIITPSKLFSINISGEGEKSLNLRKNNIFVNIFNEIYERLSGKKQNFRFIFNNKIPLSRGLGSSSAVIIGAIVAAYNAAGLKINSSKILNEALAYESHPDNIAPATLGGFVVSVLENNQVFSIKKEIDENLKAVVVIPNVAMNTELSREALPASLSLKDCVFNISHSSFLTACFLEKRYESLILASKDKLHEFKRMKALPELFEVQKLALEKGALMSTLSGSGSSFFNLVEKSDAASLKESLESKFKEFRVCEFSFNNKGFEIC